MNKPAEQRRIAGWLLRKRRSEIILDLLYGVGIFLLGMIVLAVTFGVVLFVAWLSTDWILDLSVWALVTISGIFCLLLFLGNARTDRDYLETYSLTTGTATNQIVHIRVGRHSASNINPLAPDTAHSFIKVIVSILYSAPRLFTAAYSMFAAATRWWRMDTRTCTEVLAMLWEQRQRMTFQEIAQRIPGMNPVRIFPMLKTIPGLLFLHSESPGLALAENLRAEFDALSRN